MCCCNPCYTLTCDAGCLAAEHQLCTVPHHVEQVILVDLGTLVLCQTALLDDERIQAQLLVRLFNHLLLNTVLYAEAEYLQ